MEFDEMFEPYRASDAHDEMDAEFGWNLRRSEVHALETKIKKQNTLMRQALEALEYHKEQTRPIGRTDEVIKALGAALKSTV